MLPGLALWGPGPTLQATLPWDASMGQAAEGPTRRTLPPAVASSPSQGWELAGCLRLGSVVLVTVRLPVWTCVPSVPRAARSSAGPSVNLSSCLLPRGLL